MSLLARLLTLAVLGSASVGCNGAVQNQTQIDASPSQQPQADAIAEECRKTIGNYVNRTRGWSPSEITILEEQSSADAKGFAIRHEDDANRLIPGGDMKSFHIDLTMSCAEVIRELAYQ